MSEKERVLKLTLGEPVRIKEIFKKYVNLLNSLIFELEYKLKDSINNYETIIKEVNDVIGEINEKLSLDDITFLHSFFSDLNTLLYTNKLRLEKLLQGGFTKLFFESFYDDYMEDKGINPDIRRKLREIYNKIINNEKDPIIAKVRDAQAEVDVRSDLLIYWSRSRLGDVDNELIKIFLEHE